MTPEQAVTVAVNSASTLENTILGAVIVVLLVLILAIVKLMIKANSDRDKSIALREVDHKEERQEWMGWQEKQNDRMIKSMDNIDSTMKTIPPALNGLENIIIRLQEKTN